MRKFYGLATNFKGDINYVVPTMSNNRLTATHEAEDYCKENGLTFEGIHLEKGTNDVSSVLTKNAEERKKKRGMKGWKEAKVFTWG